MLLTTDDRAPLKAIDFGLATPYNPQQLPCTDLGLEGTPWYMAPEVLSGKVFPASDIWSAGVMAYQLLSGFFPFDDARSPHNPSLSAVWKSILTDKLNFRKSAWAEISDEAKDFIKLLLDRCAPRGPAACRSSDRAAHCQREKLTSCPCPAGTPQSAPPPRRRCSTRGWPEIHQSARRASACTSTSSSASRYCCCCYLPSCPLRAQPATHGSPPAASTCSRRFAPDVKKYRLLLTPFVVAPCRGLPRAASSRGRCCRAWPQRCCSSSATQTATAPAPWELTAGWP
jgi:serine/threonine protein kinase